MFKLIKENKQYKYLAILIIYMVLYMASFCYLEKNITHYSIIHCNIDDYIPFCEYFVVPYLLWFPYIIGVTLYFFHTNRPGFSKLAWFLMIGMTIFLVVSYIFPNGHNLRPNNLEGDSIFINMVQKLYLTDTPTNILPSIHVLNTLGVQFAIMYDEELSSKRWIMNSSMTLSILIILSTMFLKQHSAVDVILAFALGAVMNLVIYRTEFFTQLRILFKKDKKYRYDYRNRL